MPEGIASIAEMQVVVDTNAEKFGQSMTAMRSVVANFAGEGTRHLAFFDSGVQKLGTGVDFLRSRMLIWLQVAQVATTIVGKIVEHGDKLSGVFGKTEDWDEIKTAAADMASSLGDGLGGVWNQAKSASDAYYASQSAAAKATQQQSDLLKDLEPLERDVASATTATAEAAQDAADATEEFTGRMVSGQTAAKAFSGDLKTSLVDMLGQVAHGFRTIGDPSIWRSQELRRELGGIENDLKTLQKSIQDTMRDASSAPALSKWFGLGDIDRDLERMGQALSRLQEMNVQLRSALERENVARIAEEGAKAQPLIDKFTASTEKEIAALERKVEMLGMAKDEAAAYAVVMRLVDELTEKGASLTGEQAEKIAELADRFKQATAAMVGFERAQGGLKELDGIKDKTRDLELRLKTIDLSKSEQAEAKALSDLNAKIASGKIAMSDQQRASAEAEIRKQRELGQAIEDAEKARGGGDKLDRLLIQGEREVQQLEAKIRGYGLSAGEAARLAMEERLLLQARQQGIAIGPAEEEMIKKIAENYGKATAAAEEMQKAMQYTKEVGGVAAKGLETAFKNWMNNTKTDTKELVRSMLADLAMLTFRRGVTEPLVGMFSQGMGSLMQGGLSSLMGMGGGPSFGGFMEDGGAVQAGQAYVVGEKRPELFVPRTSGTIIPKMPTGQSIAITFAPRIDATGAYPESVADMKRALAEVQAEMPGKVLEVVRDSRERGLA